MAPDQSSFSIVVVHTCLTLLSNSFEISPIARTLTDCKEHPPMVDGALKFGAKHQKNDARIREKKMETKREKEGDRERERERETGR